MRSCPLHFPNVPALAAASNRYEGIVLIDRSSTAYVHERVVHPQSAAEQGLEDRLTTIA